MNPRSSPSVPFVSAASGIPLIKLATEIILSKSLKDMGYGNVLAPKIGFYAAKVTIFSFSKLEQVDISLGPEMKSTCEVLGIDCSLKLLSIKDCWKLVWKSPIKALLLLQ